MKPARRVRAVARAKLTPRVLGELLGLSPATVRTWLRAERIPRLARALLAVLESAPEEAVRALRRARADDVRELEERLARVLRETGHGVEEVIRDASPRSRGPGKRARRSR